MQNTLATLDDLGNIKGKRILLRLDLNVPIQNNIITNDERLVRSKKTVEELVSKGAKVIIITHLGRPKGEGFEAEFSLKPVVEKFSHILGKIIRFIPELIDDKTVEITKNMHDGEIIMLENMRFYQGETKNDTEFSKKLAKLADVYVSDAFSAAHRAHSSTEGVSHLLPKAAGRLMEEEINALTKALEKPKKPLVSVVGGAKISSKIDVLINLTKKSDFLIMGGGMANTLLYTQGYDIKNSLAERNSHDICEKIVNTAKEYNCQIVLPVDSFVGKELKSDTPCKYVDLNHIPQGYEIFDAGLKSVDNFINIIKQAKTVIWNGPLGVFEVPPFDTATNKLSQAVAELTQMGQIISVAGGGDTVSALQNAGSAQGFSYISAAGGAFLEWMEGKDLPGVICLLK